MRSLHRNVRRFIALLACSASWAAADEFADFHCIQAPPYRVVTDESSTEIERTIEVLTELRRQFVERFRPLIRDTVVPQDIEVVFFSKEEAFRAYTQRVAPAFVESAGFFSTGEQRLVLLNQLGSSRYTRLDQQLSRRQREPRLDRDEPAQRHLAAWRTEATREARAMTERLIRHEGAHQLFHSYQVHSPDGLEPTWLTEGLAGYCEPATIGQFHHTLAERLARFRDDGALLPLDELLAHRDPAGFFALAPQRAEVAYAQSWALVYLLMESDRRADFFRLIELYRQGDDRGVIGSVELIGSQLETRWQAFLKRL